MIKKVLLTVVLLTFIISCGKKDDPKYMDPEKKAELKEVLINSA